MSHRAFVLDESESWLRSDDSQTDWLWILALLAAALVLFGINLGELPLRDWDEGTVAQVAREIWRSWNPSPTKSASESLTWLYPTLGGEPYLNKPPLIHWLMAIAYTLGGVNEQTSRLPGAMLTALSVPLLYGVGREVFHRRTPAVFAALIYLTSLPVVRHGRLAMLDGAVLCFLLLMMWCLLRSRRDSRYSLGVGIGFGLICLTKGMMVGLLLGAIAFAFLLWDTPRLLTTPYLWFGILLGSAPVLLWYGAQWQHYGQQFVGDNLVDQSFRRIWTPVENNGGYPWYYLLEVMKYGVPWLLFLPLGFKLTWENRNLSWARLVLVWSGVYFLAVSLMATKLPWYGLPLYPALSLLGGAQLAVLWDKGRRVGVKQASTPYSPRWTWSLFLLAVVSGLGCFYFALSPQPEFDLAVILAAVAIAMVVASILALRSDPQFLAVLIWGTYVSLLLLMLSSHWVWELAEAYPVKSVAQIVQQGTSPGQTVYTSYPDNRPSLNFYSDRRVISIASPKRLQRLWNKESQPYFLLDSLATQTLKLESTRIVGKAEGWTLVTREQ